MKQITLFKKDIATLSDIDKFVNEEGSYITAGVLSNLKIQDALKLALEMHLDPDGFRYYPTPEEVLEVFKIVTGKTRTRVDTYERSIHARIVEGHSLLDFASSILRCFLGWKGTKMEQYVRLTTILAPKHFDDYVSSYTLLDKHQFYMSYALQALNKAGLFELLSEQELKLTEDHYLRNKGIQYQFSTITQYRTHVLAAHRSGLERYEKQMSIVMSEVSIR